MPEITYPKVSKEKLRIAVTAPSSGLGSNRFEQRLDLIRAQFESADIEVHLGDCLKHNIKHVSAPKEERAKELMDFWIDKKVDLIFPPWGGENLIDILDLLDYKKMQKSPTWIQGYSDISTLLFAITMKTGIATVHATNFMDSIQGQDELTENSRQYLSLTSRESFTQVSSKLWQKEFINFSDKIDTNFNLTEETYWRVHGGNDLEVKGRMIGGCIDTLKNLIGTSYGEVNKFHRDYARDVGLLFYFENCEMSPTEIYRTLYNMRYAGWFENAKGVVFGRSSALDSDEFTYETAVVDALGELELPLVFDADIGHKPPQMTILNGAIGELKVEAGSAELTQHLV